MPKRRRGSSTSRRRPAGPSQQPQPAHAGQQAATRKTRQEKVTAGVQNRPRHQGTIPPPDRFATPKQRRSDAHGRKEKPPRPLTEKHNDPRSRHRPHKPDIAFSRAAREPAGPPPEHRCAESQPDRRSGERLHRRRTRKGRFRPIYRIVTPGNKHRTTHHGRLLQYEPRDPILALPAFSLQSGSALGRGAGALRATPHAQELIAAAAAGRRRAAAGRRRRGETAALKQTK